MGLISGDPIVIKVRKQSAEQACQELKLAQRSPGLSTSHVSQAGGRRCLRSKQKTNLRTFRSIKTEEEE